jgi:hypothetical protein
LVVSEDGMVDIFPKLLARIKKSVIDKMIARLQEMRQADAVDGSELYNLMQFLSGKAFYMSAEMCDQINEAELEVRAKITDERWQKIEWGTFAPDEHMTDAYFLDE